MSFAIITDSTSDMCAELREQYNIDYVTMNYVLDGEEFPASLDWTSHSPKEFYDMMRDGKRFTTTQVPREQFEEKFTYYLDKGQDVLYVSCSSALSGSYNFSTVIAEEINAKYADNKVYCVDSRISSLGEAYVCIMADEQRKQGKSAAETAEYLVANRLKVNQVGTVESLEYLKKAGRIKASKAFFGNLFGVKPIIISDIKGQNYAYRKVKGLLNSKLAIVEDIEKAVINPEEQTLYISHADNEEGALQLRDLIMEKVPFKDCHIGYITPIVGSCVGPGTVIGFCYGTEVTIEGE